VCVSYTYLTRVILFRLSGETESSNCLSLTKSLSAMSSLIPHKNPSHFLCYGVSSSYLPPAVLLPSQWIFLPKLLYDCSLSRSEASTQTNHVSLSHTHRSNKVNILLNRWFANCFVWLHCSPSIHEFCRISVCKNCTLFLSGAIRSLHPL
jgi:hypothetical protein